MEGEWDVDCVSGGGEHIFRADIDTLPDGRALYARQLLTGFPLKEACPVTLVSVAGLFALYSFAALRYTILPCFPQDWQQIGISHKVI